ncbi:Glycogen phosphorylase [Paraliobacillus sp. PM-2]|uniref:glycogen/starch/alpha-glucan phosphorylase n=1 Tax=Paraliobacillus sp. PM-2 TaxID=1462524 RepID=UPI00061C8291|nr:glycogen/starch/alpha-glucan phosphorylase [Paraliobacillus sp. PM-2]CQR47114.1 Glycogen phosphorylase [Paraliobacillus sp. PM-2]
MMQEKEIFKSLFIKALRTTKGKQINNATDADAFVALSTVLAEWIQEKNTSGNKQEPVKQVYYFSMEFLIGSLLATHLNYLGVNEIVESGLEELGFSLEDIKPYEHDPGLGNGGLGRLAACFLDSFASLGLVGNGVGLRYRYGLFNQRLEDGKQFELPDNWLGEGYMWEYRKPTEAIDVSFGGDINTLVQNDKLQFQLVNAETVRAVPYDVPIVGYQTETVNTLRLWAAEPILDQVLMKAKLEGYAENMLAYQRRLEELTDFLYPDDSTEEGRILRLKQEYFLVSAGIQSILKEYEKRQLSWSDLPRFLCFHINDTHPAFLIPELMRILVDEKDLSWEESWEITTQSVSYTNHTTLQEALETWPENWVKTFLPRIYMILVEMNERFCRQMWEKYPGDFDRIAELALIADGQVKMAHVSIVGSHSINGVAKLHTELLKKKEMRLFYQAFPERFINKTNGISHRRWLMLANPSLSQLITEAIGEEWLQSPKKLTKLLPFQTDSIFLEKLQQVKHHNKQLLANYVKQEVGILLNPHAIFDVQVKRIHGYKRQLLNIIHIIHLYREIKNNPMKPFAPRVFIFSGKAAPGYHFAKQIIQLIDTVSKVVNQDSDVKDKLQVVFLENFSNQLAEKIIPAADVSEQLSTATKEASGTGNMKMMMNGALTLGTMDGANIELFDQVGKANIYPFGLSAQDVLHYQQSNEYTAKDLYHSDDRIRYALDQLIIPGDFVKDEAVFKDIYHALLTYNDEYFVLKDFDDYAKQQRKISNDYQERNIWNQKSLINIAYSGRFSSDDTIASYAADIWKLE